jgi:hypothetical protein
MKIGLHMKTNYFQREIFKLQTNIFSSKKWPSKIPSPVNLSLSVANTLAAELEEHMKEIM